MATLYYRPYTTELQNDDNSSIASTQDDVLPEFQYIFDNDSPEDDNIEREVKHPKSPNDMDKYKLAMRRMSTEIMHLRDQMKNLTTKNGSLRCEDCGHDRESNMGYAEIVDLEKVSKDDLLRKYVSLKMKYDESCSDLTVYQDKVHKFQRDLIRKNNQEAEFIKMNKAHSSQNTLIQNLQKRIARVKHLEETIKTQELIISKMEKQIEKKNAGRARQPAEKLTPIIEVSSSRENGYNNLLQDENLRLKQEIERLKTNKPKFQNDSNMSDSERLELYQLLDRAEQRILALEKQVSISQRDWQNDQQPRTSSRDQFGLSKIKF